MSWVEASAPSVGAFRWSASPHPVRWRVPALIAAGAFVVVGLAMLTRLAAERGPVALDAHAAALHRCLIENTATNMLAEGWWAVSHACAEIAQNGGSESSRCIIAGRADILAGEARVVMTRCGVEMPRPAGSPPAAAIPVVARAAG